MPASPDAEKLGTTRQRLVIASAFAVAAFLTFWLVASYPVIAAVTAGILSGVLLFLLLLVIRRWTRRR